MRSQDEKLRDLIAEQAAEWHVAHSEGALSPERARAFMCWLRTSPMHVSEYLSVAGLARDLFDTARCSAASLTELLDERNAGVLRLQPTPERTLPVDEDTLSPRSYRVGVPRAQPPLRAPWRSLLRWTAVAATLAVLAVTLWVEWQWHAPQPISESFATRHGQMRSLHLPDGTLLQLDANSAVTVRFDRRHRRVVVDRGQAYFKVAKDPERPFSVQVGQSLVRDIGTAFDVYRHPSGATITVAEGRIQVWHAPLGPARDTRWLAWLESMPGSRGAPIADLGAGQQVRVSNTGQVTALGLVDVSQPLAWTHGHVAFDNEDVASVAAEFNRYNATQIDVRDQRVGALKISGTFDSHDVESFLAFLGSLPGVEVDSRGQRIIVSASRQRQPRHQ